MLNNLISKRVGQRNNPPPPKKILFSPGEGGGQKPRCVLQTPLILNPSDTRLFTFKNIKTKKNQGRIIYMINITCSFTVERGNLHGFFPSKTCSYFLSFFLLMNSLENNQGIFVCGSNYFGYVFATKFMVLFQMVIRK